MKKVKLVLIGLLFVALSAFSGSEFEDGFEEGHCEGYRDVKGQFVTCPVAPVAPVPQVNQDTYRGGYNAGFKKGRRKALNE